MPITISLCDDDLSQISFLRRLISEWSEKKAFVVDISEYESGEEFLFKYPDNSCDLLLLDIEMTGVNGMELAKKLRAKKDMLPIVFITGFSDYISDGYEVEALHYLIKPVDKEKLFAVLDRYAEKYMTKTAEIIVPSMDGLIRVSIDRIVFAEADKHRTKLYMTDNSVIDAEISISAFFIKAGNSFVQCHRSYIVNLRYISSISKSEITTDTGTKVPLSRRLSDCVNRKFTEFYSEERKQWI